MDNGIKLYMKQQGDTVAGKKIEIIRKDTGGVAPDVANRLAQELIVRDNVDILAGLLLSPNALAASKVSAEAKRFIVIMNAATTDHHHQVALYGAHLHDAAAVAGQQARGPTRAASRKAYTMVSDFAPGKDAEASFQEAFKAAGGEIIGSVRCPVANPDFSAFVQRAKDLNPESIYIFVPGRRPAGGGRQGSCAKRGVDLKRSRSSARASGDEKLVKNMGDASSASCPSGTTTTTMPRP